MRPQTRQFTSLTSVKWVDDVRSCPKDLLPMSAKGDNQEYFWLSRIASPSCEWHLEHCEGSESWAVRCWKDGAVG